jgi:hypothetical protein
VGDAGGVGAGGAGGRGPGALRPPPRLGRRRAAASARRAAGAARVRDGGARVGVTARLQARAGHLWHSLNEFDGQCCAPLVLRGRRTGFSFTFSFIALRCAAGPLGI